MRIICPLGARAIHSVANSVASSAARQARDRLHTMTSTAKSAGRLGRAAITGAGQGLQRRTTERRPSWSSATGRSVWQGIAAMRTADKQ